MMIRRINRQPPPPASKPSAPRERLRQWAQTPTGCRTCDKVRAGVNAMLGPRKR